MPTYIYRSAKEKDATDVGFFFSRDGMGQGKWKGRVKRAEGRGVGNHRNDRNFNTKTGVSQLLLGSGVSVHYPGRRCMYVKEFKGLFAENPAAWS